MLGLIEMDDADEAGLLDGHSTNLDRMRGEIAKATGEFAIRRWEMAVDGITSLESSTRLTDSGGEPPSKRPKLSTREKLLARAKLKSRGSSSSSTATAVGHETPSNHHFWQPHPSGDDSDVRFAAFIMGAPYLLLRVAAGPTMAIVHGTQYARGVVPHHDPSQEIVPEPPCQFTPFSSDDPLLVSEGADADGAVAPPTSSYQWILRYILRHPGHLVFLSRKSESGRSFYGTVTRTSAPPILQLPPVVAPAVLMEVAPIPQPPPLAAPAALMEVGHAADGHGQSLATHRTPAPMPDEDDVFIDDGDDDDDEATPPALQADDDVDMNAHQALVEPAATPTTDALLMNPPDGQTDKDRPPLPPLDAGGGSDMAESQTTGDSPRPVGVQTASETGQEGDDTPTHDPPLVSPGVVLATAAAATAIIVGPIGTTVPTELVTDSPLPCGGAPASTHVTAPLMPGDETHVNPPIVAPDSTTALEGQAVLTLGTSRDTGGRRPHGDNG